MRVPKDYARLVQEAVRKGWRIRNGSRHLILYPPDKSQRPIPIPGSPKSAQALHNTEAKLRRAGL